MIYRSVDRQRNDVICAVWADSDDVHPMLIASVAQDGNATTVQQGEEISKAVTQIRAGVPFRLTNDFCSSNVARKKMWQEETSKHPSSTDSKLNLCIALVKVSPTNWTLPPNVPK